MMKKITLLMILLLSFAGYSQSVLEDFETTLPAGAIVADGTEAPTVVADPAANGANGDVMKIVTSTAGESWQNSQLFFQGESLDLTTTDKVVTVDVYSEVATSILAKTASSLNGGAESATDASHGGTGWETLSFDFNDPKDNTAAADDVFGRILFFPLWNGAGWDPAAVTTTYYDNVSGLAYNPSSYDVLEDFETTLPAGAIVADGTEAPTVVADPAANGTNGDVMKIVTSTAGESWQNSQLFFQGDYLDLTTTDKVVTVDVYSDVATSILAKVATPLSGAAESATDAAHTGSGWETLTFDFSVPKDNTAAANGVFGRILFFPLWNGAGWDPAAVTTTYYDNIKGIGYTGTPPEDPAPTDAPATPPTFNANNVISLYSDAYTAAAGINNVSWDDSAFEEVSIAGNNVLKISGTNFLGIDLDAHLDATNMTHLHMDYWIATDWEAGQVLNPKLSNHAAQAGETNALDISNPINSQSEIQNWQSKDFALDGDRESIKQFLITEAGFTDLYYLDNVYLYVEGTAGLEDNNIIDVSVYPNPSNSIWNFRTGNTVITSVEVFNLLGKRVVLQNNNSTNVAISTQGLTSGIYIARITTEQGTKSVKLIKE
jgi:hypothetical protein